MRAKKRIHIAFVIWTLEGIGGSERVVYDIARRLDDDRYYIILISFKDGPIRKRYEALGIKVCVITKEGSSGESVGKKE